jgi:DNA-binding Xre family transcriptional regulator
MAKKRTRKRLAKNATRVVGRLSDEKRAELAGVAEQVEEELQEYIKVPSPARVALAKLKVARMREGLSLADVSEKTGIERGNISKLENNVDNIEINTLVRLADALGYDVVVDFKRRKRPAQT